MFARLRVFLAFFLVNRPNGNKLEIGDNISCYCDKFGGWVEGDIIEFYGKSAKVKIKFIGQSEHDSETLSVKSKRISVNHKNYDDSPPQDDK